MFRLLSALLLSVVSSAACADTVQLAVAANFLAPMQKIAAVFTQQTGHSVLISSGATGALYAQIRNGAPFEVLLAADAATPGRLEAEALGVKGSRFTYATGRLVLWSAQAGVVDAQGEVLRRGDFRRLALANPKTAPYGAAALEVLRKLGLAERLQSRLVQGNSISQAQQFVASGNAELGFVALSQVWQDGALKSGSVWLIPASDYAPIRQEAILLGKGAGKPAAAALLKFLQGEKAKAVIKSHGYEI